MRKYSCTSSLELVQKYANLVELEKCCQTHIFLQHFVLIQPRTSPTKKMQNFAAFPNFANPNPLTLATVASANLGRFRGLGAALPKEGSVRAETIAVV